MTIATRHVESEPLDALRAELVGAARRRVARRRRRRRIAAVAGALAALLALAAGAVALTGLGTGEPVVDELLEVEGGSLFPRPTGDATEALEVPSSNGTARALAFLTRAGTICHVQAERHPRIEGSVRGGGGGCRPAGDLARRLDRSGVSWSGISHGADQRMFSGYADGDVQSVRVLEGAAEVEVRMTKPWTPRVPGGEALRFFVVVDERDIYVGDDGVQIDEMHLMDMGFPRIEVTYGDGRTEVIRGP